MTGIDGYSVDISSSDAQKGLIYLDDSGRAAVHFKDMPKSTNIKGLLSISIKK